MKTYTMLHSNYLKAYYDGDYGSSVYKKRVGRYGQGKRGGFRTIIATKFNDIYFFIFGFGKNEKSDLTISQKQEVRIVSKALLNITDNDIAKLQRSGLLIKIGDDDETTKRE